MQSLDATKFRGKRVRFRAAVRTTVEGPENRAQMWFRVDRPPVDGSRQIGGFDNMHDRPITAAAWQYYEIVGDVADDAERIAIGIMLVGRGEAWIDDCSFQVVGNDVPVTAKPIADVSRRGGASMDEIGPGLFEIISSTRFQYAGGQFAGLLKMFTRQVDGKEKAPPHVVLFPLPMSYRDQVPLSFELSVSPPDSVRSVAVYQDHPHNHVLKLVLNDIAGRKQMDVQFRSVVLVGPSSFDGVPEHATIPDEWPAETKQWLAATWCVDAQHERIQDLAEEIRNDTDDILQIIAAVEQTAGKIFRSATGRVQNLTAVEALDKKGSCTSCANLVAALLRASNVPARVLSGYPSWSGPLQTHYIVEAYIPDYGWYPIESTLCQSPWPNTHQVNVAIIPPEYEAEDRAGRRCGVAGGVPFMSLTEMPGNTGSLVHLGTIEGAAHCDHECRFIRRLKGQPDEWREVIAMAKPRWQSWLESDLQLNDNGQLEFGQTAEQMSAESASAVQAELMEPSEDIRAP